MVCMSNLLTCEYRYESILAYLNANAQTHNHARHMTVCVRATEYKGVRT